MSYRNRRLIPHPVLSADWDDYQTEYEFTAEVPESRISGGGQDITIRIQYRLNAPTLNDLVSSGQARYCAVIECPKTYRRSSHRYEGTEDLIMLNRPEYDGTLTLTPYLAAVAEIPAFNPPELTDELRQLIPAEGVDLPAGAILAIGPTREIKLDNQAGVDSIIDLAPHSKLSPGEFDVDLSGQRIAIQVHPDTMESIRQARNRKDREPLLHQALYLYAIDKAVRNLKDHEGKRWADVIRRKLSDHKDIDDNDDEALAENSQSYAQWIFENPLGRMLTTLQQDAGDD